MTMRDGRQVILWRAEAVNANSASFLSLPRGRPLYEPEVMLMLLRAWYLVAESFPTPGDYPTEILSEPAVVEDIRMEDAIPGDHPLTFEERLVNLWPKTPQGGLSPPAERMLAQSEGSAGLTIGDLPIPGDTLSLEDVRKCGDHGPDCSTGALQWRVCRWHAGAGVRRTNGKANVRRIGGADRGRAAGKRT
ncbi:MAG TPA: hypothetical protein VN895_02930 [Candidatus Acidoferrum sp.]|nr:hypothetical protein [Candidatus Acidoferrum sp.]